MSLRRHTALSLVALLVVALGHAPHSAVPAATVPGARVLLDAHNCYPYQGRFADRIDRALATGLPVAIEQDLIWREAAAGRPHAPSSRTANRSPASNPACASISSSASGRWWNAPCPTARG